MTSIKKVLASMTRITEKIMLLESMISATNVSTLAAFPFILLVGQFFAIKSKKNIVFLINLKAKKVFPQGFEWI